MAKPIIHLRKDKDSNCLICNEPPQRPGSANAHSSSIYGYVHNNTAFTACNRLNDWIGYKHNRPIHFTTDSCAYGSKARPVCGEMNSQKVTDVGEAYAAAMFWQSDLVLTTTEAFTTCAKCLEKLFSHKL